MRFVGWIAPAALLLPTTAHADAYTSGLKLLERGETVKAITKLERSPRPEAAFQIASMAEAGQIPACDLDCAVKWYMKAADGGLIVSVARIGAIYERAGRQDIAAPIYNYGARWGEVNSRAWLLSHDLYVPDTDLLRDYQQRLASAHAAEIQRQQVQAAWGAAFMAGVMNAQAAQQRRSSYQAPQREAESYSFGMQPPPPLPIRPYQSSPAASGSYAPVTQPPARLSVRPSPTKMCPDGSYISGSSCHIAPDGTFHGGQPQIAPDGSYVGGRPVIAPNGSYVGSNSGQMKQCPDGSYVGGSTCVVAPNGRYVGQ